MECPTCGNELLSNAVYCPRCSSRIEGAEECGDYAYEAFISYRHLELDRKVAMKIQRAVEGFRIPKQLQEAAGKQRLGKCFRDEDELPTSASLSDQILDALQRSRYLIVICSKATRESLWVQREVETFASYHGRDHILIVLAEGEPSESFPELLLSTVRIGADGAPEEVPSEPIAADFRDLSRGKCNVEKLRIIATLVGCSFDDLRQRARLRRNKVVAAITSGIAVVSSAFGGFATYQQKQIEQSYRQVQIEQSEFLATESTDLLAAGDRYQAVQVALAALPESSASIDRPYVPAARLALEQSLGIYPGFSDWSSLYSQTDLARANGGFVLSSESGLEAFLASDYAIEVRQTDSGNPVCRFDAADVLGLEPESYKYDVIFGFAGQSIMVAYGGYPLEDDVLGCFDARDGSLLWSRAIEGIAYRDESLAISADGSAVAVVAEEDLGMRGFSVLIVDASDGSIDASFDMPGYMDMGITVTDLIENPVLAFSDDGARVLVGRWGTLFSIDIATGSYAQVPLRYENARGIDLVGDRIAVVSDASEGYYSRSNRVCIEVFDASLNLLWSHEGTAEVGAAASGSRYERGIGVFGTWNYFEDDREQLIVLFGNELLLLDAKTGAEVFKLASSSSFLDCLVCEARGRQRLFALMGDGTLICRRPLDSNDGLSGTVSDITLGSGRLAWGDLSEAGGRVYCSMVMDNPAIRRTVWRFSDPDDLADNRLLGEGIGDSEPCAFYWSAGGLVVETREGNIFVDPETLEVRMNVPYSDLGTLDMEHYFDIEECLDDEGNLYVVGPMLGEDGESASSSTIFRVNGADGSVDIVKTLEGVKECGQFSLAEREDGQQLLVLITKPGYEDRHVVLICPDGQDGVRVYADLVCPDATSAHYVAGGKLLVSIDEPNSPWDRCALLDLQTGEEIACDLAERARYWASRRASVSHDGRRFVTVCEDGALRMFDTETGAQLWESFEVPSEVQYLLIVEDGSIFMQDAFGRCMLISGLTGKVLTASSTTLPPIKTASNRFGTGEAIALFNDPRIVYQDGLAVISLNEDSFGPQSVLYDTYYISTANDLFLYIDGYTGEPCSARMLSLDELIEYGEELTSGHELTDAERHFYQTGERTYTGVPGGYL